MNKITSQPYSIAVIMSTYNGELFLKQQLDSILGQENVKLDIFIRDDGSMDATQTILSDYCYKYSNIHVECGTNEGAANSFMDCLYSVNQYFDYYAFSDQDDVWLPGKLAEAIKILRSTKKNLYCSNQMCVNKELAPLGLRFDSVPGYDVLDTLTDSKISGCTFVFTNKLKEFICLTEHRPSSNFLKCRIHDVWIAEISALREDTIYDKNSYILYRQHENNVIGAFTDDSLKGRITRKLKKLRNKSYRNGRSRMANEVYSKYPEFRENDIIKAAAFADSVKGKLNLIKNYSLFSRYDGRIKFYLYVLLGFF